jgi:signal transduction histidine kinase
MTARLLKNDGKDYFVGMGVDISSRIKAETELLELNRTLEQKVAERTEQLEDANEDLTAANEELSAANEELTSMNEEIQAMNEELTASNDQLITMQAYLVESEKMAALGGLVAGVAHEVNTPIGVGLTASSHLSDISNELLALHKTRPLTDEDVIPFLEDIEKASQIIYKNLHRAAQLIQSFKQLSVDQSTEPRRQFDIGAYIEEVLLSLSPSLKKTQIKITTSHPESILVNGYPGSIAQIITNLVMNSLKHAYRPGDSGLIHIETTRKHSMVQIVYSDDGLGMDEYTLSKIYEPFFTTNRSAGGSGLGLSIIYSIVTQQYEGSIKCTSKPGEGTTFIINLKEDVQ